MSRLPLVFYHGPVCNDGFGAALAASYHFGIYGADYCPMNYGKERDEFMTLPAHYDLVTDRNVFILDFSFKFYQLKVIADHALTVTMLDHHETAAQELEKECGDPFGSSDFWTFNTEKLFIQYDKNRSGAMQAWQHFNSHLSTPKLITLLDAYDLWNWQDGDDADALSVGIQTLSKDLRIWEDLLVTENLDEIIARGKPVVSFIVEKMKELEKHAAEKIFSTQLNMEAIPCLNAPYFLASRLGNRLAKAHPSGCACIYSITDKGEAILSFRSINEKAKKYALYFGGGGHANAAGATVPLSILTSILAQ